MNADVLEFVKKSKNEYEDTALFYSDFKKRLEVGKLPARLNVVYGIRGAGKTTLMFQNYLEAPKEKRVYFHGLELALKKTTVLEAIEAAVYLFGTDVNVFIDEVNQVASWAKDVEIAFDKYPTGRFLLSGSSSINLLDSKEHLARRAHYFHLKPLSLREFIYLKYSVLLDQFPIEVDLLRSAVKYDIYLKEKLRGLNLVSITGEYIEANLPYLLEGNRDTLQDLVEKAIFIDIAKSTNLDSGTLSKLERLVLLLSASSKVTYEVLSRDLGVSKSSVSQLLGYLEKADIIKRVYPFKKGKTGVRKEWKYFFQVPAIRKLYAGKLVVPESTTHGSMLEDIFASSFDPVFFSEVDFVYNGFLVEIGASKDFSQVKKSSDKNLKKLVLHLGTSISHSEDAVKMPLYMFLLQR